MALDIVINDAPVATAPVDVPQTFDTTLSLSFADLLVNASDADLPLTVENITASDPLVGVSVSGTDVTLTVPAGYVGTPILSYDVVDGGAVPARTAATAELDFDTLQMQDSGTVVTGPDSLSRNLLTDVTGDPSLGGTVATATAGDDAVIWDAVDRAYAGITEFRMLEGSDFLDLSGASGGFRIDLGAGADIVIGSSGNDVLIGGTGADSLTGGAGADIFVLASGPIDIADVITDFGAGDQIDLRSR
ncbi:MAG: cadherin-like domain-containing protein [Rhodobacteraceae bacterium]|nr:cadherin-like domain-containing protein [Paracoccaceae bacterium]